MSKNIIPEEIKFWVLYAVFSVAWTGFILVSLCAVPMALLSITSVTNFWGSVIAFELAWCTALYCFFLSAYTIGAFDLFLFLGQFNIYDMISKHCGSKVVLDFADQSYFLIQAMTREEWCKENCKSRWWRRGCQFIFLSKSDAVHFKMVWG